MDGTVQLFDIANELIILPKAIIDTFLKYDNPDELIALYTFYYYTAKWQETNRPHCTTGFTAKGLHWYNEKVIRVKKQLSEIGLIKDYKQIDEKTHKVKGWYITVNYIFKQKTVENAVKNHPRLLTEGGKDDEKSHPAEKPDYGKVHPVAISDTNALSSGNLNALSSNNKIHDIIFPDNLNNDEFKKAFSEWIEYKKSRRESYKNEKSIYILLNRLSEFGETWSLERIQFSMMNNYAGLIFKNDTPRDSKITKKENDDYAKRNEIIKAQMQASMK